MSEEKQVGGLRYNQGKARTELLCPIALMATAEVLTKGALKYAPRNWEKGMSWGSVVGCLLRHTFKFMAGHDIDRDDDCEGCQKGSCVNHTGLPHVDLIACNAMFLQNYYRRKREFDDRSTS